MDDKSLIAQCADVAQDRTSGCSNLLREVIDRRSSVAAKAAHDGVLAETSIHFSTIALLVTKNGTVSY